MIRSALTMRSRLPRHESSVTASVGIISAMFDRRVLLVYVIEREDTGMTRYLMAVILGAIASTSCAGAASHAQLSYGKAVTAAPKVPEAARQRGQADPLEIDVYPRIAHAQSDAWIKVRVEPDPRSRSVDLEWFSAEGGGGAHMITLEGDRAAIRHQFPIKRLAPGEYEVTAVLTRNDGTRVRRVTTMRVVGLDSLP